MASTAKRSIPFSVVDLLLIGHPGEVLPDELEGIRAQAQWYVADANHPEDARQRVMDVWITGDYRPAYDARVGR